MYDFPGAIRETPYGDYAECEPEVECHYCGEPTDPYDDLTDEFGNDICRECYDKMYEYHDKMYSEDSDA